MLAARRLSLTRPLAFRCLASPFHSSAPAQVQVGDRIPHINLMEGSPGNKVNLAQELKKGKGLIIGVPAAFSPACSESHIPGYINSAKLKDAGSVFVVSVNDAFVMKAWGKILDPSNTSGIRFLADPGLNFTNALDLSFDGSAIFGGHRGKRYALLVEDGFIKEAHVESDNTGLDVSAAGNVLGS
ncbi:AhpC/TSA family protein [Lindgomyces ingoldianus]|uniref:AhpC/TSA family protein n=1 Tax=Lindgomyces ingoldianus TaxID=673940 RepID=A0ACB6RF42_9PLEO|nr:AhpC/TSA family protein [Lindgomyces ingoldianus]KAF2477894.1 AhpC/TSA family protein [Lindgomyces ingoldianus]